MTINMFRLFLGIVVRKVRKFMILDGKLSTGRHGSNLYKYLYL